MTGENKLAKELDDQEKAAAQWAAMATTELLDIMHTLDIEIDYVEADWRDTESLITESAIAIKRHPNWTLRYFNGDMLGIDSNYVLFTSKPTSAPTATRIMELIVNEGADIPELPEPPTPKCPECKEEIEFLISTYKAEVPIRATLIGDILDIDWDPDLRIKDIITDDQVDFWHCVECDAELFTGDQFKEMEKFLKGETYERDSQQSEHLEASSQ